MGCQQRFGTSCLPTYLSRLCGPRFVNKEQEGIRRRFSCCIGGSYLTFVVAENETKIRIRWLVNWLVVYSRIKVWNVNITYLVDVKTNMKA
jgi:hypothetical protein